MAKDAYYFSHDSNAKDDPKCVMLIEQLGLEGYGIFWVLIETLREQPSYKYPVCLIPALARRFNTTADKMRAVVNGYGLFCVDENDFFSISLMERMKLVEAKREQARQAIQSRWDKQKQLPKPNKNTDVIRPYNDGNTDELQGKERKGKESKIKDKTLYGQKVLLTSDEYDKLIQKFGIAGAKDRIENLDLYIQSKNKKYDSHYATILTWERKNKKEEPQQTGYRRKNDIANYSLGE
jgi:hypothetical protein